VLRLPSGVCVVTAVHEASGDVSVLARATADLSAAMDGIQRLANKLSVVHDKRSLA
jgi:hypothetical protein